MEITDVYLGTIQARKPISYAIFQLV